MHLQIIICINVIIVLLIIIIIVFISITIIIIIISNYGRPDVAIIRQRIQLKPQQFGREAWLLSGIILIVIINIITIFITIITRQKQAGLWLDLFMEQLWGVSRYLTSRLRRSAWLLFNISRHFSVDHHHHVIHAAG